MSIFRSILDKIFHHGTSTASAAPGQPSQSGTAQAQAGTAATSPGQMQSGTSAQPLQAVDVEAVLSQLAAKKGGGGNWRTSIVDTLKLLDLDSSLTARKELATELNVHAGADGSAEQNIALQKAVMAKLAENGGKVPDSLRH